MRMGRMVDLSGRRFGMLTVVSEEPRPSKRHRIWLCRCDCGNETKVRQDHLGEKIQACGCLQKMRTSEAKRTHSRTESVEYTAWCRMKARCYNRNSKDYPEYGGRGIQVDNAWLHSFEQFLADMGPRPSSQHSVDRIDNSA